MAVECGGEAWLVLFYILLDEFCRFFRGRGVRGLGYWLFPEFFMLGYYIRLRFFCRIFLGYPEENPGH